MSLFLCDRCGVIENTALSGYWTRSLRDGGTGEALCSECDKGEWHGRFPRQFMTAEEIATKDDWTGYVDCERLKGVWAAHNERVNAEAEAKAVIRRTYRIPQYPDHINRMKCGTRAQRAIKKRAKQMYAESLATASTTTDSTQNTETTT